MKKRMLSLALVLCMLSALFVMSPITVSATSGTCGDNLTWRLEYRGNARYLIISGTGSMANYSEEQRPEWFEAGFELFARVIIEEGVTSIGDYVFYRTRFGRIVLPDSVTAIGEEAFYYCDLTDIAFGRNVKTIGRNAFHGCDLTNLTLPNNLIQTIIILWM